MNHEQIDQHNLIERYLMGRLFADERDRFEAHFVACPRCTERLQTTGNFVKDFRLLAAELAAAAEARRTESLLSRVGKAFRYRSAVWIVAALLVAAIFSLAWSLNDSRRLREEVNQTRRLAEQWQRRYEDEQQAERQHQEAEARQAEQLRALAAKLEQQQTERAEINEPAARRPAEGELPLFVLTAVRGREGNLPESDTPIVLRSSANVFALTVALEEEARSQTYSLTILDDRKQPVWKSRNLRPGSQDALSIWLKSALFRPGRYALIVEADNKEGQRHVVGTYPFVMVKKR